MPHFLYDLYYRTLPQPWQPATLLHSLVFASARPQIELNQKPTDMLTLIPFSYQGAMWLCSALIDCSDDPCYIFVTLYDRQLINQFGDEITIKTDFNGLLPKKDDTPELVMLRQAIFDAVQPTPEFIRAQARHPY
jgi:hypothetical protein